MYRSSQLHHIETAVNILAPSQVGVRLVPATDVEQAETSFFWCSAFFGVFSAILGALISVWAGDVAAGGVTAVLLVFLVIFFGLFVAFGLTGFKKRQQIRTEGKAPTPWPAAKPSKGPKKPDAARLIKLLGLSTDMFKDLRESVFGDRNELPESDVIAGFLKHCSDDVKPENIKALVNDVWAAMGMLERKVKPDGSTSLKINREFNSDAWFHEHVVPIYYSRKKKGKGKAQPTDAGD